MINSVIFTFFRYAQCLHLKGTFNVVFDDNFLSSTIQSHVPHPQEVTSRRSQEVTSRRSQEETTRRSQEVTSHHHRPQSEKVTSREVQTVPVQVQLADADVQTDDNQPPTILGVIFIK